uniref:Peptide deformylase n=1 Tax=Culicoides sonorensis TaxID=179676 RepID=A0A336MUU5_CULSO
MKFPNLARIAKTAFGAQTIHPPYSHTVQIGDPVLRSKCMEIPSETIKSNEVQTLINHMIKIMRESNCVGLACNQLGMPYQIMTMEFTEKRKKDFPPSVYKAREMQTLPLTVIINPKLTVTNFEKIAHVESCQSVRGYSGEVSRYKGVAIEGFNENGEAKKWEFNGWNARIAQHEVDHLNGVVYTDKMDPKTFICTIWEAVNSRGGRVQLPFFVK